MTTRISSSPWLDLVLTSPCADEIRWYSSPMLSCVERMSVHDYPETQWRYWRKLLKSPRMTPQAGGGAAEPGSPPMRPTIGLARTDPPLAPEPPWATLTPRISTPVS